MARPPLTVRRSPTGYVLHDPILVQLAGIDDVPLPFTARAPSDVVLNHLRRLSPHRTVRLGDPIAPLGRHPSSSASDVPAASPEVGEVRPSRPPSP